MSQAGQNQAAPEFQEDKTSYMSEEKNINCEKTVIISDEGVKLKADSTDDIYDQTRRFDQEMESLQFDFPLTGITPLECELYQDATRRESSSKYKLQRKLVSGGMGAILQVTDQDLQRTTAMKVVLPNLKNDRTALTEFIREAKITGLLEHPNIIPLHELGLSDDLGLYFTMKLADGQPLNSILAEIKNGTPEYVEKYNMFYLLNIFRRICDAIAFAHSKNIIHQDIKPHNVIVGQFGEVLVMDWGLARFIGDPEKEIAALDQDLFRSITAVAGGAKKIIQGSPAYMSPEQVTGDCRLLDKKTDIFLLGATLHHMFTLEAPYKGKTVEEVLAKVEKRDLPPPQKRNPSIQLPEELCRIIMKAMELKKEDRYPSVLELISDVDDIIAGKWSRQEKKQFAQGEFLMREGETANEGYLILKGRVQVSRNTGGAKIVLSALEEGDIVGEMALITDEPRSASVEAMEDTEVAVLTKQQLEQNLKKLPPYMEKMVATITRRLQTANIYVHPHLTTDCSPYVLQQLCLILKTQPGSKKRFEISFAKITERISEDLGLPPDKVEKAFINAAQANLLEIRKNNIIIEDINRLMRSAKLAKSLVEK